MLQCPLVPCVWVGSNNNNDNVYNISIGRMLAPRTKVMVTEMKIMTAVADDDSTH